MCALLSLPVEIAYEIVGYLEKKDVANVRLTNRALNDVAVRELFSSVTLYARFCSDSDVEENESYYEDSDEGEKYDPQMFRNILQSETLKQHVRKVGIYTCEPHCVSFLMLNAHQHGNIGLVLSFRTTILVDSLIRRIRTSTIFQSTQNWWSCTRDLKKFPLLSAVNIHFDRHASDANVAGRDILHEPEDRVEISHRIFSFLVGPDVPRIKHLGIRHCQGEAIAAENHAERRRLLDGLPSLRMSISHGDAWYSTG